MYIHNEVILQRSVFKKHFIEVKRIVQSYKNLQLLIQKTGSYFKRNQN